jgi:phosphate transport system substrate-binding protein
MKVSFVIAAAGLVLGATAARAQEEIVIGGAGSIVPVMQELSKAYLAKNSSERIKIIPESVGSTGGIKATAAGRFAIGLTGRPLKPEEQSSVVYRELGVMPVVFAVNGGVPATSLTQAQICAIYQGKVASWKEVGGPDLKIIPLTRNEDDSDKEAVRKVIGCYRDLTESPAVIMLTKGSEMASALGARAGTIGLTTYANASKSEGRYQALAFDGVVPSPAAVQSGKYPLVKSFAVVTRGAPSGAAKRFLDFTASAEGKEILTRAGLVIK